jgi:hypothetical protein
VVSPLPRLAVLNAAHSIPTAKIGSSVVTQFSDGHRFHRIALTRSPTLGFTGKPLIQSSLR